MTNQTEEEKKCKHKWKKINQKMFKSKAEYHCNKCGVLGIDNSKLKSATTNEEKETK